MKKINNKLKMIAGTVAAGVGAVGIGLPVAAAPSDQAQGGIDSVNPDRGGDPLETTIQAIINTVIMVVGIIAVVMIILGGIQYTTSQGDPGKVKKAKDTIMYGIIGLVVAILAFAIVNFVLSNVFG